MNVITGNILDISEGVICHQVNCQRVAGAGLALQIRCRWPDWYKRFLTVSRNLGEIWPFHADYNLWIVSLYAQEYYGHDRQYTDYSAMRRCFQTVRLLEVEHPGLPLCLPFGIGCGLGGGKWEIVSRIIEDELPHALLVKFGG